MGRTLDCVEGKGMVHVCSAWLRSMMLPGTESNIQLSKQLEILNITENAPQNNFFPHDKTHFLKKKDIEYTTTLRSLLAPRGSCMLPAAGDTAWLYHPTPGSSKIHSDS